MPRRFNNSKSASTSTSATEPTSTFGMPDASTLFPSIELNPRDLDLARRNTVFLSLVRDAHAELYRLRENSVRAGTDEVRSKVNGRVEGIEWILGRIEDYFAPAPEESDEDQGDVMTVEFN